MKQNKLEANSVHQLEATVADLQSQICSHSSAIGEIIGTVNDSLTTPEALPAVPAVVTGNFGNMAALAATQATIVSLQARSCQQASDLNRAYQVQENATQKSGFDGGRGLICGANTCKPLIVSTMGEKASVSRCLFYLS